MGLDGSDRGIWAGVNSRIATSEPDCSNQGDGKASGSTVPEHLYWDSLGGRCRLSSPELANCIHRHVFG